MQKNDFEKQVQHQLEDFSLLPGDAVWQKVEARVKKEKERRRILFFWMFAAVLLLGSGTGIWFISNNNDEKNNSVAAGKPNTSLNIKEQKTPMRGTEEDDMKNQKSSENLGAEDLSKGTVDLKKQNTATKNHPYTSNKPSGGFVKNFKQKSSIINEEKSSFENNKVDESVAKSESKKLESNATIPEQEVKENNNITEEKVLEKPGLKTTPPPVENEVVPAKKISKQSKKPLVFGAMVLGGISNNGGSIPLFPQTRNADRYLLYASPSQGQSSQAAFNYMPAYDYSSSYSWGAGVFLQKQLAKKTGISIGLSYQLMAANIIVGSKVDSLQTFQDSVLLKAATVASFYRAGKVDEYRSKYHLLQIPINILFQLNRNINKPLTLSAGFTGGVLVGSNALYLNEKARTYYKEKDHFKRLTLSAQSGIAFTLLNHRKYQIQAGPHVQYQLSNLTKPAVYTNEHLWFLGLKGNILFKKTK
ncbi:MAG TPA: hypothetical protein VF622_08445 [Segetibacter sp.]|jgi:hypothetical protein